MLVFSRGRKKYPSSLHEKERHRLNRSSPKQTHMASPPLPALSTCKRRGPFSHRTGRTPNPLLARPPLKPEKGGTESALFSSPDEALARAAQDATLLRHARRGSLLWAAEQLQQPFPHGIKAKRDHTTYFTSVPTFVKVEVLDMMHKFIQASQNQYPVTAHALLLAGEHTACRRGKRGR